jgi:hypothetical protein
MRRIKLGFILLTGALFIAPGGCREKEETPKYRNLPGRVTAINTSTGEVEMSTYIPKQRKEVTLKGKLAPDAEILIDGSTARFEDVHIDDRVDVEGRLEKHGGEPQLVATKVRVTRGNAGSSSAPATAPGAG